MVRAVVALVGVAVVTAAASSRAARADDAVADAEAEIRLGTELRYKNQDARALPHFERAYQLSRNPRTAAQLGLVKMALGYCVDAERLLDEALAVPDHPWISRNLSALEQTRENARRNIGQVSVSGTPAGASVMINGRQVGTLPLSAPLRLDRGPIELEVRAAGYMSITRTLRITGGAQETVAVALVPAGAPAVVAAAPPAPVPAAAPTPPAAEVAPPTQPTISVRTPESGGDAATSLPLRPLAFTAAGLSAAALVLGIVETVVARNRADDFNDHTVASPTAAEPDRRVADCETSALSDDCRSIRDAHDRARTLAIVGYAGAGVFALASAYLFVRATQGAADAPSSATAGAQLTCSPTLAVAGLSCRLAF